MWMTDTYCNEIIQRLPGRESLFFKNWDKEFNLEMESPICSKKADILFIFIN